MAPMRESGQVTMLVSATLIEPKFWELGAMAVSTAYVSARQPEGLTVPLRISAIPSVP